MLLVVEVLLFSAVMYVTINDQLFDGFTPAAADIGGHTLDDLGVADYLARAPRLVALWLDRTYGAAALGAASSRWRSSRSGCCGARDATSSRGAARAP